jgi:sugar phosphate isomerase/epimerase
MNRRDFMAGASAALALSAVRPSGMLPRAKRMGVTPATYAIRWGSDTPSERYPGFQNALDLLEHSHALNAGGVQIGVGDWAADFAGQVRDRREALDLYLEGQIRLPRDESDVERFDRDVMHAREAGATIVRSVCLGGRRYETFATRDEFEAFRKDSYARVELAEPVMREHQVKLAIENHKDWRVPDMLALLEHMSSEWVGVTLDTGNNLSLLEDPMVTVEALAPYTMTTHFKDMGVEEYEEGFLLAEVPLGEGFLDLAKIVEIVERHNPDVTWNLEMITRDPLPIPCLTEGYWATFGDAITGQEVASLLNRARSQKGNTPLPRVSNRNPEDRLAFEEENNRSSFAYAQKQLGMV